ncbi:response regulator transcription factor [Parvibium lacunae]|uniref:DNA-binding response regulator n=1 Tax=Parvibium lacunae TaxID=1888893 RepID=A0A368L1Z9_9BURK|nr:response regulator transcription factor [Parvibium lacunae]RCS57567.1 DNA-binding response regulator [Parvibium lacunae]
MHIILADDQPLSRYALRHVIDSALTASLGNRRKIQFFEWEDIRHFPTLPAAAEEVWLVIDEHFQGQRMLDWIDATFNTPSSHHKPPPRPHKIILVCVQTESSQIGLAFKAGIDAYIARQQDVAAIQQAFVDIAAGKRVVCLAASVEVQAAPGANKSQEQSKPAGRPFVDVAHTTRAQKPFLQHRSVDNRHNLHQSLGLTARESDVLRLLADGYSNKQIALHLAITEHTVKVHLTKIFRALRVNSRAQALVYLMRNMAQQDPQAPD